MLIVDDLTRNDERTITTLVHEARLLRMSLESVNAAGIGFTSFTHYPIDHGEEEAICPEIPADRFYNDAKVKIIDAIIQSNLKPRQPSMTGSKRMTVEIPRIKEIKSYIQTSHVDRIRDLEELIKKNPPMIAIVDKKNLTMPEMYHEIMKVNDTVTINVPSAPIESTSEPTIVVHKNINRIKNAWKTKYGISKPTLDLQFEMVKTYGNELVQDFIDAWNQSLDLVQDVKELRNQGSQQR
jgi:hypothetical protein